MQLDGTSYGKSSGIGYDLGLLWQVTKSIRLGMSVYDVGGTDVSYKDKTVERNKIWPFHEFTDRMHQLGID